MAGVGAVIATPQTTGSTTEVDRALMGKDTFLKLLVAQLQNQDPLEPMDNKDFIGQLSQLNSAEQLTTLNDNFSDFLQSQAIAQASGMIGKTVQINVLGGTTVSGTVSRVVIKDAIPEVEVNGVLYPLEDVAEIT